MLSFTAIQKNRRVLVWGALLGTLIQGAALAQTTALPSSMTPPVQGAATGGQPADSGGLQEILVTAQRRSERLIDVPISITALGPQQLEAAGVNNLADLQNSVPGVTMAFNGGFLQPSIRGVSSTGSNPGDESNVAVYIDGVYQPSQSSQLYDLPDVSQLEVLKGPQGTLYGQNAAGGAIIISTVAPSFTPTGDATLSYGNFNDRVARGYYSGPISDAWAFMVSGAFEKRDGYDVNLAQGGHDDGLDSKVVRAKLLYKPDENSSITFGGYWFRRIDTAFFTGQPLNGDSLAYVFDPAAIHPNRPWQYAENQAYGHPPSTILEGWGASVHATFDTSAGTFNSISAFSQAAPKDYVDYDYTNLLLATTLPPVPVKAFTEDLSFVSHDFGHWRYTAGIFYMSLRESFQYLLFDFYPPFPFPFSLTESGTNRKESFAAYAETTFTLDEHWSATAGLRHSLETQDGTFGVDGAAETQSPQGQVTFEKTTPRVSLNFAIDRRDNVYFTYSQGFKSGLLDIQNLANPPVKPENVIAYELGYKGEVTDALTATFAIFHYDYKDIQVQVQTAPGVYGYENAAAGRINGAEGTLAYRVTPALLVNADFSYLNSKYVNYPDATVQVPNVGGGNTTVTEDVSGNEIIRTPRWTANLGSAYELPTAFGTFNATADAHYNGAYFFEASNRAKEGGYMLYNAELGFAPSVAPHLRVALYGHNLADKAVIQSYLSTSVADGIAYAPPRMFGLKFNYHF